MYCGGREVKIELDVYGPDGDDNIPVCKIIYTGVSGWACGAATLRPKYVATINGQSTHTPQDDSTRRTREWPWAHQPHLDVSFLLLSSVCVSVLCSLEE
jgi:hypothetical protein